MPELPEVETIRADLEKKILHKPITGVDVFLARAVKPSADELKKALVKNEFSAIDRTGKLMIFKLKKTGNYLLVHLKMTGQLVYCSKDFCIAGGHSSPADNLKNLPDRHTRAAVHFSDKSALYFNDLRTFGYLRIIGRAGLDIALSKFGINPLNSDLNIKNLAAIFKNRKANIKSLLLDQRLIAGIGNIYADEILFAARIRPDRTGGSITINEAKRIVLAIRAVLKKAIKYRGTTFNNYVDSEGRIGNFSAHLKVYGRKGEKCLGCAGKVIKTKLAGRGTYYCPKCQK